MFGRLMPTEGKFFELFNQHAELCVKGAKEMLGLMTNFDDLENRVHAIESIEKQADKVTYATVEMLHKTFITPIDRDDIHQLITRQDDILDLLQWRIARLRAKEHAEAQLFRVTFDNQATEWVIGFGDDGKIAALLFRPAEA